MAATVTARRHPRVSTAVLGLVTSAFLLSACGTRVERQSSSSGAQGSVPESGSFYLREGSAAATASAATTPAVASPSPSVTATAPAVSRPVNRGDPAATNASNHPSAGAPAAGAGQPGSTGSANPSKGGSVQARPGSAPAPAASTTRSPLIVASVGTYSGPVGNSQRPMLQGAQAWVADINSRGGLNGHQVKLLVFDDGFDPSRHRAQVQEAVELRKALAFLQNGEPGTGEPSVAYVTEKRIPVIGQSGGERWNYTSPMYFPQTSSANFQLEAFPSAMSRMLVPRGKTKIGTVVCVEAQICTDSEKVWAESANRVGMEYVYRTKASITQPDYTAECLAARNAGAQALFMMMDTNTIGRVAASCARQSYRPTIAASGQLLAAFMEEDPNLDGMVASFAVVPWFAAGTPATDALRNGLARFAKDVPLYQAVWGWVSGKLLEKAGANLPEPPTTEAILNGLWSIKDDTLGGLTMPLTFVRDEKPKGLACGYDVVLQRGRWVSPDNLTLHCP